MPRIPRLLIALAFAAGLTAAPAAAATPTDRDPAWVVDGSVEALARDGQTLYLGGSFERVSAPTGPGVIIGPDGTRRPGPGFDHHVGAAIPDGAGGAYVGGFFDHVDGKAASVVHLLPDGSVDPAFDAPAIDNAVRALAVTPDHVYVAGKITRVDEQPFSNLIRIDRATGAVDPSFKPVFSGYSDSIDALAVEGGRVLIGGSFTMVCKALNVGCEQRDFAAAIDIATGAVAPWAPNPSHDVNALLVHADAVFLAGSFACVGTETDQKCDAGDLARPGVAKVGLVNGAADPAFDAGLGRPGASLVIGHALIAAPNGAVLLGGDFSCTGYDGDGSCTDPAERVRRGLARLSSTTGAADTFATGTDGIVAGLAVSAGRLWVGGDFEELGGQPRSGLGALDPASGTVLAADPSPNREVTDLAPFGDGIFAGGAFSGLGGVERSGLAAIDLQTGTPTDWGPRVDGGISALIVHGGRVYAGGSFTAIDGQAREGVAALDPATGALQPWDAGFKGAVFALAAAGDTIYAGGGFSGVAGTQQSYLAAVSATDGGLRPGPEPGGTVHALAVGHGQLYVGGDFTGTGALGDEPRTYAGAVDLASGAVTPWAPAPQGAVRSIAVGPGGVMIGGNFGQVGGHAVPGLARVDAATGAVDAGWSVAGTTSGSTEALAYDGERLVVGGYFPSGPTTQRLLLLDAATGARLPWSPVARDTVYAVAATAGAVYVGGSFAGIDGRPSRGLALFTPAPALRRAPAIGGDGPLVCDPGDWEGAPRLSLEWLRDGAPVGTGADYALSPDDRGHALTCRVTATSIRGSASADSPPRTVPTESGTTVDRIAPVLSKLKLSKRKPKTGRRLAVRFALSEAAAVRVAVERRVRGRRAGKRCRPGAKRGKPCRTFKRVALVRANRPAGRRALALPRKRLRKPGAYRLVVRATDAAGNLSAPKTLRFTLRRP